MPKLKAEKVKLTDKLAKTVGTPSGGPGTVFDAEVPHFGVRIQASGKRSWHVQYWMHGRGVAVSLGDIALRTCTDAREEARKIMAAVKLGRDPAQEKADKAAKARDTFGAHIARYLDIKRGEVKPKTMAMLEPYLLRTAKPLHHRPADGIDVKSAAAFLATIPQAATRNRVKATLAAYHKWLIGEGFARATPWPYTNNAKEAVRERTPSIAELVEIWHAADALPGREEFADSARAYGKMVQMLMLTGCRREEIAQLARSEIEGDRIVIPAARSKNRKPHLIPLTQPMRDILAAMPPKGMVFRDEWGRQFDPRRRKERLDATIAAARGKGRAMEHWTLHDFRRSMITTMQEELKVPPHIAEACLNHFEGVRKGVKGVYNKAQYFDEKKAAFEAWNDFLMGAIHRPGKVVPLRRVA